MPAASPAISMAASMTEDSLNGAVLSTILFACTRDRVAVVIYPNYAPSDM